MTTVRQGENGKGGQKIREIHSANPTIMEMPEGRIIPKILIFLRGRGSFKLLLGRSKVGKVFM